jgi:hypothetical protein
MAGLIKRGKVFYATYYCGGRETRRSLGTTSLQVAKEKLRHIESARHRGDDSPLLTLPQIDEQLAALEDQPRRATHRGIEGAFLLSGAQRRP